VPEIVLDRIHRTMPAMSTTTQARRDGPGTRTLRADGIAGVPRITFHAEPAALHGSI
jgi:hypothetical protein